MIDGGRPACLLASEHPSPSQVTIYGWSTDVERLVNGSVSLVDGMVSGHAKDGVGWAWSKASCW
jgi:hypothetical protein